MLAIVGRPNVGKSALVNRIIGRREAVVQDVPRRHPRPRELQGRVERQALHAVDTGGWEPDARGINASVAAQAGSPSTWPTPWLFVVDVTVGITATDEHVVMKMLRGTDRPVIVVANKADDDRRDLDAFELWNLGLGEPHPSRRCTAAVSRT